MVKKIVLVSFVGLMLLAGAALDAIAASAGSLAIVTAAAPAQTYVVRHHYVIRRHRRRHVRRRMRRWHARHVVVVHS